MRILVVEDEPQAWIARVHGGDVVLARSSASGSTFTVTLPLRG
jgi:signal transduction histidine kinase